MEQFWEVKKMKSFEPRHIFECGQCFRWNRQEDGSYIGIFGHNVIEVQKEGENVFFKGVCEGNIQDVCKAYFDLNRDYEEIKKILSQKDEAMRASIAYGNGIRLLNQDLWETILSFIISANNNIPRIKGIIERLSKTYGEEILYKGKCYYTFPTPEQLKNVSIEEYRAIGAGFRDIRLYETTHQILEKTVNLEILQQEKDFNKVRNSLLTLSGVGPKVADCILLFSTLKRLEAFPIDVWVRRVMNELYIKKEDETKVKKEQIQKIAKKHFGEIAGLAQQYLFYWKREA